MAYGQGEDTQARSVWVPVQTWGQPLEEPPVPGQWWGRREPPTQAPVGVSLHGAGARVKHDRPRPCA